jgi:hypothetical protein
MKHGKHRVVSIAAIFLLASFSFSCKYYNEEDLTPDPSPCDTTNVSYTNTVLPIFEDNCLQCHSTQIAEGNVILDTYDGAKVPALDGRLWKAVSWEPGYPSPMPKGGSQLSSCDQAKIRTWIDHGIPQINQKKNQ